MHKPLTIITMTLLVGVCGTTRANPDDPYEALNRKTYKFNQAFDATFLKPPAKLYQAIIPAQIRSGINNVYNNINMIPTVANDLLQAEWNSAIKDTWRFIINSSIGIGGIFDPAEHCSLPLHSNDVGITFAKWGDKKSPYLVIPFLGPSTFRDGMGMMFNFMMTPYPYLDATLATSLVGLRYIDLRSQMFETERLMDEAIDKYAFMRDAYLQHRHYLITGEQEQQQANDGELYIEDTADKNNPPILPQEPENDKKSDFPITTS